MSIRKFLLVAATTPVLAGCGTAPLPQMALLPDGVYEWDQHLTTTNFSGHLQIAGDSVRMLDAEPRCFEKPLPPTSLTTQQFVCGQFNLFASRGSTGRWTFKYVTGETRKVVTTTCSAFTKSGDRQGCSETQRQTTEKEVTATYGLALTRVTDTTSAAKTP
ncbi:MAG TPA: hypothetical protein VGM82_11050 [Gemmatimonadaceae bacterium]